MGILVLVRPDFPPVLVPVPSALPGRAMLAAFSGAWMIAASVAVLPGRTARSGALAIASLLSVGMLLHVRQVFRNPGTPAWAIAFETVVLGAAAFTLAGMLARQSDGLRMAGRWGFGVSLLAFGLFHFLYGTYIESVVPVWIPGHLFWTYGIGCALIAAGIAMLSGIKARLAATMLAIMFGSWVFIVHAPRVAAAPSSADEWSSLFIALACCGASLIMRESTASAAVEPAGETPA